MSRAIITPLHQICEDCCRFVAEYRRKLEVKKDVHQASPLLDSTYSGVSDPVFPIAPVDDGKERVLAPARRRPARDQIPRSGPAPLDVLARDEGRSRPRMRRPLLASVAHRVEAAPASSAGPSLGQSWARTSVVVVAAVVVVSREKIVRRLRSEQRRLDANSTPTQRSGSRTRSGSVSIVCRLW
jgi:hypothetical protein